MKKKELSRLLCLLSVLFTLCAASCARQAPSSDARMPEVTSAEPAAAAAPAAIDLDLMGLSGVVVYAQVNNLVTDYQSWLGKIIRIEGYYTVTEDSEGTVWHACVIPDATQCCAQGLEFVWAGNHEYPDDYPEEGAGIIVTGRLELYRDLALDTDFLHLVDADLVIRADS